MCTWMEADAQKTWEMSAGNVVSKIPVISETGNLELLILLGSWLLQLLFSRNCWDDSYELVEWIVWEILTSPCSVWSGETPLHIYRPWWVNLYFGLWLCCWWLAQSWLHRFGVWMGRKRFYYQLLINQSFTVVIAISFSIHIQEKIRRNTLLEHGLESRALRWKCFAHFVITFQIYILIPC